MPAHGEPHDSDHDEKLKKALHGGRIVPPPQPVERPPRRPRRGLPSQASATARARFGGQRGVAQRSAQAREKAQGPRRGRRGNLQQLRRREDGAVIEAQDGAVVVQRDVPEEQLVDNPKLESYDAIAEVLDD